MIRSSANRIRLIFFLPPLLGQALNLQGKVSKHVDLNRIVIGYCGSNMDIAAAVRKRYRLSSDEFNLVECAKSRSDVISGN